MSVTSRLPLIPAAELAAIWARAGSWEFRVEILRPGDVVRTNLSDVAGGDWVHSISTGTASPDQPVGTFQLSLLARADGRTLSPGIQSEPLNRNAADVFAPLVYAGAYVWIYAGYRYLEGVEPVMRFWKRGRIDRVSWPGNDVVAAVATPDRELERAQVESEGEIRGAPDPGVPLAEEIEDLLHTFSDETAGVTVLPDAAFPTYAQLGVGEYRTSRQELGPFLRQMALRIGADFRYWYNEAAGEDVPTFFLPPRDHTTPDATIGPGVIQEVMGLDVDREHVRPYIEIEYFDVALGRRRALSTNNEASRIQFGRAPMYLSEGDESPVKTEEAATNLLGYAAHDVSQPPADKQVRLPFCPWLSLHDVLAIDPDDVRFDASTIWSVTGLSHQVTAGQTGDSVASLRGGSPIGAWEGWELRPRASLGATAYGIFNLRKVPASKPGYEAWEFEVGSKVDRAWSGYVIVDAPPTADDWTIFDGDDSPVQPLEEIAPRTYRVEVKLPAADQVGLLQLEPRYRNSAGVPVVYEAEGVKVIERLEVYPVAPAVALDLDFVQTGKNVDLLLGVTPNPSALPVSWEVREGGVSGTLLASGEITQGGVRSSFSKDTHPRLGGRLAPSEGKQTWFAIARDSAGLVYYDHVEAGALKNPTFSRGPRAYPSSGLLTNHVSGLIDEPGNQAVTLFVWRNPDGVTSADPEDPPTGSIPLPQGGPYTFGPSDPLLADLPVHPGVAVSMFVEAVAADGRTTGKIRVPLESSLAHIFDEEGEWVAGSIATQLAFAEEFRGWTWVSSKATLDTLTPEQFGNTKAYTYDPTTRVGQRYQWSGSAWVADNSAPVVGSWPIVEVGIVTAEVIASLALRTKLAGIERLIADNLNIGQLSLISNDVGAIVYGQLVNALGDAGLDLEATGSQRVLWGPGFEVRANGTIVLNHGSIQLNADGSATFAGEVSSDSFTAQSASFLGGIYLANGYGNATSGHVQWGDDFNGVRLKPSDATWTGGAISMRLQFNTAIGSSWDTMFTFEEDGDFRAEGIIYGDGLDIAGDILAGDAEVLDLTAGGTLRHNGGFAGFFGVNPIGRPTVSGSRGANAALASLCTALASLGLIIDSTS